MVNNKLENRITKLEKLLKINEEHDRDRLGITAMKAVEYVTKASDLVSQIIIALNYDDDKLLSEWESVEDKLNDMVVKLNKLGFKL